MVQAGVNRTFGLDSGLSGVTPGDRNEHTFQRASGACANTQFGSRKVRLVGSFCLLSFMPSPNRTFCRMLATAFLAGEPTIELIVSRASEMMARRWRWLGPLARRYSKKFSGQIRPRHRDVVQFLLTDRGFRHAYAKHFNALRVKHWLTGAQRMQPVKATAGWNVPVIESVGELARWLGLTPGELEWVADLKGLERRQNTPRLRHYNYRILVKLSGNVRLIEAPKRRLKEIQKQILDQILNKVPLHPAVHGFAKRRSIKTFTAPHTGQRVVLRMDLQDFFPCITGRRIQALFRTMGYPEPVADLLGGLCTNATPRDVWQGQRLDFATNPGSVREAQGLYTRIHLPQGAPTSPTLANLCAYRLDCRLSGLAKSVGARYTRYADDLAFSGREEFDRCVERFSIHVAAILLEEGFAAHHRKTRIMRQGVRQHLAGLVANRHVNTLRHDFDRLKAILTNCVRHGSANQNRERHPHFRAHLEGRLSFMEMINPTKSKRLRKIFERIDWAK